jgi:hypothetical protein
LGPRNPNGGERGKKGGGVLNYIQPHIEAYMSLTLCRIQLSVGNNIILQYIALFGAYYISAILRIAISY